MSTRIPLRAAYTGLTIAPWVALAHSDLAPLLILHDDAVESRVIWRRRRRPYSALAGFRIERHGSRSAVTLTFRGSPFTFVGVLSDPASLASVTRVLVEKGVPTHPCSSGATPVVGAAVLLALGSVATPSGARAAQAEDLGIDCKTAVSTPDMALCINDAYEAADDKLNAAYKAAMASIDQTDVPPEAKREWRKALIEAQRRWIAFRDAECELTGFEWYGGTGRSGATLDCARELTVARTKALQRHADPR